MKDLSMHILDIAGNSIKAGAKMVEITIKSQHSEKLLALTVEDDGCGMDQEMVQKVTDPFVSTRTTRKVGLGLPLLMMNARQTGGELTIDSVPGKGTKVEATFCSNHIDCVPLGDIAGTVSLLMSGNPEVDFVFEFVSDGHSYRLKSLDVKSELEGMAIWNPQVVRFLRELIQENLTEMGIV